MERKKICIIGGGASGLMAAIMAAREGGEVTLLEHNEKTGKKLLATGNGRCNLTNTCQEPSCYHSLSGNLAWEILQGYEDMKPYGRQSNPRRRLTALSHTGSRRQRI